MPLPPDFRHRHPALGTVDVDRLQFTDQAANPSTTGHVQLNGSALTLFGACKLLGTVGYFELSEISDPAAPVTNIARLYVRDNGAGKSQLVVRFPTGAIQVLATEP